MLKFFIKCDKHLLLRNFCFSITIILCAFLIAFLVAQNTKISSLVHYAPDAWVNIYVLESFKEFLLGHRSIDTYLHGVIFFPSKFTLGMTEWMPLQSVIYTFISTLFSSNPVSAYNIQLYLNLALNFFSFYYACSFLNFSKITKLITSSLFASSPLVLSQLNHFQNIPLYFSVLAFCNLLLFQNNQLPKFLKRSVVFCVLQLLTCLYTGIMTSFILSLFIFYYYFKYRGFKSLNYSLVFLSLFACIAALPQLLASIEHGTVRTREQNIAYSADILSYFSISNRSLVSRLLNFKAQIAPWEKTLYFGCIYYIACIFSPFVYKNNENLKLLYSVSVICILFSFGPELTFMSVNTTIALPYSVLFEYIPILKALRVPARWSLIALIPLSFIVAFWIENILKAKRLIKILGLATLGLCVFERAYLAPVFERAEFSKNDRELIDFLSLHHKNTTLFFWPLLQVNSRTSRDYEKGLSEEAKAGFISLKANTKTVNGYSGLEPKVYSEIVNIVSNHNTDEIYPFLLHHKVDFIILRKEYADLYYTQDWPKILKPPIFSNPLYEVHRIG
jgi:hypothetical protein